jgi:hypothetical protein
MRKTLTSTEAVAVRKCLSNSDGCDDLSGWATAVLAEIRGGSRSPPAIKHPLGFICIQLYRTAGWGLCIHVWKSPMVPASLTTSPIHSHSWDLFSQVLCGRLENIEICVADASPYPTHRILEVTSLHGTDQIRPTQRLVCWTRTDSVYIGAGENYSLPAGTFHVSRPSEVGLTATVLLAEDRYASPELALGRLDSCDHVIARQACPPREMQATVDVALRGLAEIKAAEWERSNDIL